MIRKKVKSKMYDVIGVGIGPFNLSLAALLDKVKKVSCRFFEQRADFSWHPGMLLNNAKLQVNFLKDLSSCVDPTNPHTFLSYLAEKRRIYQFLNCKKSTVSRKEFNDYFQWASARIPGLSFNDKVFDIKYDSGSFSIISDSGVYAAKNIVIGTGTKPYIPEYLYEYIGENFFHSTEFKMRMDSIDLTGKSVVVIGGGQSGAEVFDTIISSNYGLEEICWVSRHPSFETLEDSCFANEIYTPNYVESFYNLPESLRQNKLKLQRRTSDGITEGFANDIYNKLYEIRYLDANKPNFKLVHSHSLYQVTSMGKKYRLSLRNEDSGICTEQQADVVILATGYRSDVMQCLRGLLPDVTDVSDMFVNSDYSIRWANQNTNRIYVQNGAKHTHGVADPNLSLAAWRNATIINSLLGENFYNTSGYEPLV